MANEKMTVIVVLSNSSYREPFKNLLMTATTTQHISYYCTIGEESSVCKHYTVHRTPYSFPQTICHHNFFLLVHICCIVKHQTNKQTKNTHSLIITYIYKTDNE
jgi:hypothetical protein